MKKLFFETIKIENKKVYNIEFHNKRFKKTVKDNFNIDIDIDLKDYIFAPEDGLLKCKIIYDKDIVDITYTKYIKKEIKSLKLINSNIKYPYKYLDREEIDKLYEKREDADDIIIVKNSFITDTSIANIAFFDGKIWVTPKNPLLKGSTRERLLKNRKIFEKDIKVEDLKRFKSFALLNAMIGFYEIKDLKIV